METQSRFHQLLYALPDTLGIDHRKRKFEQYVCESDLPGLDHDCTGNGLSAHLLFTETWHKIDVIYLPVSLLTVILFTAYMPVLPE